MILLAEDNLYLNCLRDFFNSTQRSQPYRSRLMGMKEDILKEFPLAQGFNLYPNGIGDNMFSKLIFNFIQWPDLKI